MENIAGIRRDYKLQTLTESAAEADPLKQFTTWWKQAMASDIDEVNAMTLSTVGADGRPSSRIVLLKGFDEKGFVFFTNYQSRKATDLQKNPHASLVFFWKELERQVRVEGTAEKTSDEENDRYFNSRPDKSKIGAWASPQSTVIESREMLEENEAAYNLRFKEMSIPRPPHWGGFKVNPVAIEFWQGRPGRLHDRIRYKRSNDHNWIKERLAP